MLSEETVPENSQSIGTPTEHPFGCHKTKERFKAAEAVHKKIKLAEAAVQLQKSRNEALDIHSEIMLFSNSPVRYSESGTVKFFDILRAEALSKARVRVLTNSDQNESTSSMPCLQ